MGAILNSYEEMGTGIVVCGRGHEHVIGQEPVFPHGVVFG